MLFLGERLDIFFFSGKVGLKCVVMFKFRATQILAVELYVAFEQFKCISLNVFVHIGGTICNSHISLSCQRLKRNTGTQLLGNANLNPREFLRLTLLASPISVSALENKFWASLVTRIQFQIKILFFFFSSFFN